MDMIVASGKLGVLRKRAKAVHMFCGLRKGI